MHHSSNMDPLRHITLFVTVARCGGFRAAADQLGLPSSTVSRRIAELEAQLGLRLFTRTTRRVELTDHGRLYLTRCEALVDEAAAAQVELTQSAVEPSGLIRASMPVDFAADRITAILADFLRLHPKVRFELDLSPHRSDLIEGRVDFVIRIGAPAEPGLIQRKLTEVPVALYAAPAYLAGHGVPASPSELAQHTLMAVPARPLPLVHPRLGRVTVTPNCPVTVNNVAWLKRLTLQGLGLAVHAPEMIAAELAAGLLVPVLPDWQPPPIPVYILTESRLQPARVRLFLDHLARRIDAAPG